MTLLQGYFIVVPRAGIEPALPKKLDFESNVSTSFTTPALLMNYK